MKGEESEEAGVAPAAAAADVEAAGRGREELRGGVVVVSVAAAGEVAVGHPDKEIFRHVRATSLTIEFKDRSCVWKN